jgi:hypothetical protein
VYQQQEQQEQQQDAENPFLDPPFSRIKIKSILGSLGNSIFWKVGKTQQNRWNLGD